MEIQPPRPPRELRACRLHACLRLGARENVADAWKGARLSTFPGAAPALALPDSRRGEPRVPAPAGAGPAAPQLSQERRPRAQGRNLWRLGKRHDRRPHARSLSLGALADARSDRRRAMPRSEEHTSELQSLMRN